MQVFSYFGQFRGIVEKLEWIFFEIFTHLNSALRPMIFLWFFYNSILIIFWHLNVKILHNILNNYTLITLKMMLKWLLKMISNQKVKISTHLLILAPNEVFLRPRRRKKKNRWKNSCKPKTKTENLSQTRSTVPILKERIKNTTFMVYKFSRFPDTFRSPCTRYLEGVNCFPPIKNWYGNDTTVVGC